jgi:hypothetical protein
MNLGFFRSRHAIVALLAIAVFSAWHFVAPQPFGYRSDENVLYLLTTGWVAVTLYLVLALYAARRAAHRLRLSPEFGWEAQLHQLEAAQTHLSELQNRINRREIADKSLVKAASRDILRKNNVQRVLRVDIQRDKRALGLLQLDVQPRNALGRLSSWLSAHVWYGIAAALLVWFHGGGRSGTTMGLALNSLSYFVIGSGLVGAMFWSLAPTWLTRAERELTIEKAFALRDHFDRKVRDGEKAISSAPQRKQAAVQEVADLEQRVQAAKSAASDSKDKALKKAVKDAEKDLKKAQASIKAVDQEADNLPTELVILKGQRDHVRKEAARLDRYRTLLRGWRILHVPCSVVLLALVAVHVISIYYY